MGQFAFGEGQYDAGLGLEVLEDEYQPPVMMLGDSIDPNLVGWWKFDETSGTIASDSSGNGYDGTLDGNPQWVSGKLKGALAFDGQGDHVIDNDGENYLNGLSAVSVAMWIKSDLTNTDRGFINGEQSDDNDNVMTMRYDAAGAFFGGINLLKVAVTSTPGGEQQLESSSNLQTTEWQHVAMTWVSGGLIRFYVNGVEDTPSGRIGPNNAGTVSGCTMLVIGAGAKDNNWAGEGWDGLIDDVRIYSRALSAAEIMNQMATAKWAQVPDTTPNGIYICADSSDGIIRHLADNFECRSSDKITQITIWGSWKGDVVGNINKIHVEIHPDDPVGNLGSDTSNLYSKPGSEVLWSKDFGIGQFYANFYHQVSTPGEWWHDPVTEQWKAGGDDQIWQIDIPIDANKAFQQSGSQSEPVIYWLHVQVDTEAGWFGWKTRHWPEYFMGDAVWDIGRQPPRFWRELRYQQPHPYSWLSSNSIDMAFMLVSEPVAEYPTSQPVALTTCPAVDTVCPPVDTECPAHDTECPAVDTECPSVNTQCPTEDTRCPPVLTRCFREFPTGCDIVDTHCPVVDTECPIVNTKCPPVLTQCKNLLTSCPTDPHITQCPHIETHCPPQTTLCPLVDTQCSVVQTQCQGVQTACPVVDTKCPHVLSKCFCMLSEDGGAPELKRLRTMPLPRLGKGFARPARYSSEGTRCPAVDVQAPFVVAGLLR